MEFDPISSVVAGGALILLLLLFFWLGRGKRSTAAIRFSGIRQLVSAGIPWRVRYRWVLKLLRLVAIALLLIAFARPRMGLETIRTAKEGVAIQMVIDRSSSMQESMEYRGEELDRLEVVKRVFEEFVIGNDTGLGGRSSDMIGLASFAGFAEENAPLTLDHQSLVSLARTVRPAIRIEDGTMIGDAIYYAVLRLISVDRLLEKAGSRNNEYKVNSKIVILLTDGQQTRGGKDPLQAAQFAKENSIKVYTIAIAENQAYQRNTSIFGQFFSLGFQQIDTTLLERVAEITGGIFAKASSGEALVEIYRQIDQMEKTRFEERFTTFKEQFKVPVVIAFLLLLLEVALSQTLFRKIP